MRAITLGLLGLGLASPAFGATAGMEQWEFASTMESAGMKMPMPTVKRCENPNEPPQPPAEGCTLTNLKTEGNTTRYSFACTKPEAISGSGVITRTKDAMDATFTMKSASGEMSYAMTGKRLGPCPKE